MYLLRLAYESILAVTKCLDPFSIGQFKDHPDTSTCGLGSQTQMQPRLESNL